MTSRSLGRVSLAIVLVLPGGGHRAAQTSTGGLRGFVKDGTGGVLAGVTVEARARPASGRPPSRSPMGRASTHFRTCRWASTRCV